MSKQSFVKLFLLSGLPGLFICNTALAYDYGDIEIGLTGTYFRPTTDNGGFGINASTPTTIVPPSGQLLKADSDEEWGGSILLAYRFPQTPYLVAFTYSNASFDSSAPTSGTIAVTDAPATFAIDFATQVNADLVFHNNIYSLMLGAEFYPNRCITFVPKIGATYLDMKNNQSTTYTGGDIAAGTALIIGETSIFKGLGPTIGADLDFMVACNFSIFASMNYTPLIGDITSTYSVASALVPATINVDADSDKTIVNFVQTEIALAYAFNCYDYAAKVMVGYSISKAFDSSESNYLFVDDVADANFVSAITSTGFHGLFVRVNVDLG